MARTTITPSTTVRSGLDIAGSAAGAELQWRFANTGRELLMVKNGGASPITVTIDCPKTVDGLVVPDLAVTVANGVTKLIGPFPKEVYNQADGTVNLDLSAATSVSLAAISMGALSY